MRFICWFTLCDWRWIANGFRSIEVGIYQCPRCKSLLIGAARVSHNEFK